MTQEFTKEFHSLCAKHGIRFAAVCVRDYEGFPFMYYNIAEAGADPATQRDQAAGMHFDIVGLADAIKARYWPPPQEDPNGL